MKNRLVGRKRRIGTLLALILVIILLITISPAYAHTPGVPRLEEVTLEPILLKDGDQTLKITLEEFSAFYHEATDNQSVKNFFTVSSYRAVQSAFQALWGKEIPKREELKITSRLPAADSVLFFQMLTGEGAVVNGKRPSGAFHLVLKDGRVLANWTKDDLQNLSKEISAQDAVFSFGRTTTGKTCTLSLKDKYLSKTMVQLWLKAQFSSPAPISLEEQKRYYQQREMLAKELMTAEDWQLFKEIKPPLTFGSMLMYGYILVVVVYAISGFVRRLRKQA